MPFRCVRGTSPNYCRFVAMFLNEHLWRHHCRLRTFLIKGNVFMRSLFKQMTLHIWWVRALFTLGLIKVSARECPRCRPASRPFRFIGFGVCFAHTRPFILCRILYMHPLPTDVHCCWAKRWMANERIWAKARQQYIHSIQPSAMMWRQS